MFKKNKKIYNLISELGRQDLLGPNPAIEKLSRMGRQVIPYLIELLDNDNLAVVEDAIYLLGVIGAKEAIPKLRVLAKSQWAEVRQASWTALAILDKSSTTILQLNRHNPYEQIAELWTSIIQSKIDMYPPDTLYNYCTETIRAMPELTFSSKENEAKAWGMLGSLIFKSLNPEWEGGFGGTKSCPEAKNCYEEALRCEPGDSWWEDWIKRFS